MSREEEERQADLEMMKGPDAWACWPLLPMKKVEKHDTVVGFLMATGKPKLYLRNFMDLHELGIRTAKEVDEKIPAKEYANFEEILNDGWIVD